MYDLDGVLYLAGQPVPHAAVSVAAAATAGLRPAYVTNNASRRPPLVAAALRALGIAADDEDVVTSGQAAARWLAERLPAGSAVLVLGTESLAEEVADSGLTPVRSADDAPAAVVQGLAPETGWTELAEAAVALRSGALWVAGNADSTYPSPRGPLPGNGAMVAALRTATGRTPVVVGKPEPELHRLTVERVGARRPLVVGDRLDTDVLGAVRAGADSLLVLTGVVDRAELLKAPAGCRPTYVADDLRGLLRPQPPVDGDTAHARCGGARAVWDGAALRVRGGDEEGLRAPCALAWRRSDAGLSVSGDVVDEQ